MTAALMQEMGTGLSEAEAGAPAIVLIRGPHQISLRDKLVGDAAHSGPIEVERVGDSGREVNTGLDLRQNAEVRERQIDTTALAEATVNHPHESQHCSQHPEHVGVDRIL